MYIAHKNDAINRLPELGQDIRKIVHTESRTMAHCRRPAVTPVSRPCWKIRPEDDRVHTSKEIYLFKRGPIWQIGRDKGG
jgi:hypothetical protein